MTDAGRWAGRVPRDRNRETEWMFPLFGDDDREDMTRIWQMAMPADVFAELSSSSTRRLATAGRR